MTIDGEYVPSPQSWVRKQVELYESSGGAEGNTMRGRPVIILTTVGARTGVVRKSPLMRVEHDGVYAAVASMGGAPDHPKWYGNILSHPIVELQDGPVKQVMSARVAEGAERELWWERAVQAWPDYAQYQLKTSRTIPVVVLEAAHDPTER